MTANLKYSDVLNDILLRQQIRCNCPTDYLKELLKKRPKPPPRSRGCGFGSSCRFPNRADSQDVCTCNAPRTCGQDTQVVTAKDESNTSCTCGMDTQQLTTVMEGCNPSCTCGPGIQQLMTPRGTFNAPCNCGPDLRQLLATKQTAPPNKVCSQPRCICVGACLCKSDESVLSKINYLPSYFRNSFKSEALHLMTDEMMKQECAEIKQLIYEHIATKNVEEESRKSSEKKKTSSTLVETKVKKPVAVQKEVRSAVENVVKDEEKKINLIHDEKKLNSPSNTKSKKSTPVSHTHRSKSSKTNLVKKIKKKEKITKPKLVRTMSTKTHNSRRSSSEKKKPIKMRYYYSGGIEHYGVKLGHKQCQLLPQQVPKTMGWLWNIEDPSKGIRERKGWPPGFIGKSIKNMIKAMKRYETSDEPSTGGVHIKGGRWKSQSTVLPEEKEQKEDPPLLHIHKKGRTYNITFCPKNSDEDIGPVPIPFTITDKKHESEPDSSESSLEFELHSPKPGRMVKPPLEEVPPPELEDVRNLSKQKENSRSSRIKTTDRKESKKKQIKKKSSRGSEENKILWEEQQTQIQNIA